MLDVEFNSIFLEDLSSLREKETVYPVHVCLFEHYGHLFQELFDGLISDTSSWIHEEEANSLYLTCSPLGLHLRYCTDLPLGKLSYFQEKGVSIGKNQTASLHVFLLHQSLDIPHVLSQFLLDNDWHEGLVNPDHELYYSQSFHYTPEHLMRFVITTTLDFAEAYSSVLKQHNR